MCLKVIQLKTSLKLSAKFKLYIQAVGQRYINHNMTVHLQNFLILPHSDEKIIRQTSLAQTTINLDHDIPY